MRKSTQTWLLAILALIIALVVIFVFNPFDLRTRLVGAIANSYLNSSTKDHELQPEDANTANNEASADKPSFLNEEQAKALEEYGVDVDKLPSSVSPEMEACFIEKLGEVRTQEIVEGDSPTATEVFTTRNCLDK